MEHRYNSNKVLDYKRTPSKSKKRTLNDSTNNSFISTKNRALKYQLQDPIFNYTKGDQIGSGRISKTKKQEKRSVSNAIRKTREMCITEDQKNSILQSSSKKERSSSKKQELSSSKQQKSKPNPYTA
jgi:hypothetical protein